MVDYCVYVICAFSVFRRATAKSLGNGRLNRRQYKRGFSHHTDPEKITMQNLTCHYYNQPLDHFSPSIDLTFNQRYCIYDGYQDQNLANNFISPIFFYTGNESPLDEYVNNTGLMYELAAKPHFSALVVFAEHRFEGESIPDFDTLAEANVGCFTYLTSSQTLADFASLISYLNPEHERPVITFGGSYGGMLSSWMRMKYPGSVAGAVSASAPIFGLPLTMNGNITTKAKNGIVPNEGTMDGAFHSIGNAIRIPMPLPMEGSTLNGASENSANHCFDNLLATWPLMKIFGQTQEGRKILSQEFHLCSPLENEDDVNLLLEWAQSPWFDLAEGDYPYASSYIPFALGEGEHKLPAFPLNEACHGSGLSEFLNITIIGDTGNVLFDILYGNKSVSAEDSLALRVDWGQVTQLEGYDVHKSSIAKNIFSTVKEAVAMWFNVTKSLECFDVVPAINTDDQLTTQSPLKSVQRREQQRTRSDVCFEKLQNETVWTSLICNENMNLIMTYARGVGRDFFWPPSHPRNVTSYKDTVGNRTIVELNYEEGCKDEDGYYGYPEKTHSDPWSTFLDDYYGGTRIDSHSNIVFSNGLLDPWSAAGVFPKNPCQTSSNCSIVQNITKNGEIVALVLDLGAHHLDLMYSHKKDPPCVEAGRIIHQDYIKRWIRDWEKSALLRAGVRTEMEK